MSQVTAKLRRATNAYCHWCPGCEEMHHIPDSWAFGGDVNSPTFTPSVKITGKQTVVKDGEWTGEWVCGPDGKALDYCCHYILTAGVLNFCGDCTHHLSGKSVPLPDLPPFMTDQFQPESPPMPMETEEEQATRLAAEAAASHQEVADEQKTDEAPKDEPAADEGAADAAADEDPSVEDKLRAEMAAAMQGHLEHVRDDVKAFMAETVEPLAERVDDLEKTVAGLDAHALLTAAEELKAVAAALPADKVATIMGRLDSIEAKIKHWV